jgi:hypothetical protein
LRSYELLAEVFEPRAVLHHSTHYSEDLGT